MKKIITVLFAVVIIVFSALPVFAAESPNYVPSPEATISPDDGNTVESTGPNNQYDPNNPTGPNNQYDPNNPPGSNLSNRPGVTTDGSYYYVNRGTSSGSGSVTYIVEKDSGESSPKTGYDNSIPYAIIAFSFVVCAFAGLRLFRTK